MIKVIVVELHAADRGPLISCAWASSLANRRAGLGVPRRSKRNRPALRAAPAASLPVGRGTDACGYGLASLDDEVVVGAARASLSGLWTCISLWCVRLAVAWSRQEWASSVQVGGCALHGGARGGDPANSGLPEHQRR